MGLILRLGLWERCDEPKWIHRGHLYSETLYVNGKTFVYKVIGNCNGITRCYRKLRR